MLIGLCRYYTGSYIRRMREVTASVVDLPEVTAGVSDPLS
jgi:hypothetical protein